MNQRAMAAMLPVVAALLVTAAAATAAEDLPFDPDEGIDDDGAIPRALVPADLPHPDQWRYIPPGRMPPGGILDRLFVTTFITPELYFEEDTGLGGGIALADIDFRTARRREFLGVFLARSSEGEEDYSLIWQRALHHRVLPGGGVLVEESGHLRAGGGYNRTRTQRFFGFGADSREEDESSYTDESGQVEIGISDSLPHAGDPVVIDLGLRLAHRNLARGQADDLPSATEVFAGITDAGDDRDQAWALAAIGWDTRDSDAQPYVGWDARLSLDTAFQSGGAVGSLARLRASLAWPLPSPFHDGGRAGEENPPTDSLNIGGFVSDTLGDLPFYDLPALGGGDTLRGYIDNRFVDRAAWHASIEWRAWPVARGFPVYKAIRVERLGFALFYDVGTVAAALHALDDARVRSSWGAGLRMGFERVALFRLDVGFGDEGANWVLGFGNAF